VLFVGGLTEVKGVRDLVAAVPQILGEHPGAHLVVAGQGPLDGELRALTDSLGVGGAVLMQGGVDHDDVCAYMNAADVLVLPSYSEGLPVCLMEAAAVGLPVVASDVGGSSEIVALNRASVLIEPGDPSAIAKAVGEALDDVAGLERSPDITDADPYSLVGAITRLEDVYASVAVDGSV
jgi:glycosyltransferase involved in cell wall biosynthesis